MIEKIVSFVDGGWVPDPSKISANALMSVVIADRLGPDEIEKVLRKTNLPDHIWRYSFQDGKKIETRLVRNLTADFSEVGAQYYLNQFLELDDKLIFWLPDFSEFSVLVFRKELYAPLSDLLEEFKNELDEWISSEFWTENERQFILKGKARYTVAPLA
jgi:hypothetical protein